MDRPPGGRSASRGRTIPWLLLALVTALGPAVDRAAAQPPAGRGWAVSAGLFDIDASELLELGVEYRFAQPRVFGSFHLAPTFGVTVNEEGGFWVYGALRYDLRIGERWTLTPSLGAAYYERGDGKELGQELEFRSALELSRRLRRGGRLGIAYYHLSNAGLSEINPGSNSLVLVYAFGS